MGIGKRIKEARENLGLTQNELGELVGVTGSAITNYEKETSHPKEPIMYKLLDSLNVDANFLFQDVVNISSHKNDVTLAEYNHIKQYRNLDEHGKKMVDFTLSEEHKRWETEQENSSMAIPMLKEIPDYLEVNAAHDNGATEEEKAAADRIMMDDSEWE